MAFGVWLSLIPLMGSTAWPATGKGCLDRLGRTRRAELCSRTFKHVGVLWRRWIFKRLLRAVSRGIFVTTSSSGRCKCRRILGVLELVRRLSGTCLVGETLESEGKREGCDLGDGAR